MTDTTRALTALERFRATREYYADLSEPTGDGDLMGVPGWFYEPGVWIAENCAVSPHFDLAPFSATVVRSRYMTMLERSDYYADTLEELEPHVLAWVRLELPDAYEQITGESADDDADGAS